MDSPPVKKGPRRRLARSNCVHISMPSYMGRHVRKLLEKREQGPSEFFRSMYDQALAAKLPLFDERQH